MPMLLENASATGAWMPWNGGAGVFTVAGNFGGATVTLQFMGPDGVTAIPMGVDTTISTAGGAYFVFSSGRIRAAVTGGSPTGLYAAAELAKG